MAALQKLLDEACDDDARSARYNRRELIREEGDTDARRGRGADLV